MNVTSAARHQHIWKAIVLVALTVPGTLIADVAMARFINISGTHSSGEIKSDCANVGGTFYDPQNGTEAYGCYVKSKGTSVSCDPISHKCTGWVPRKVPSHSLGGILRSPSAGVKSSGASAPPKGHHHPVKVSGFRPPSRIKTTGGTSSPVTIIHTSHSGGRHK